MTSEATKTTEKAQAKEKEQPKKMYGRTKARVQKGWFMQRRSSRLPCCCS